MDVLHIQSGSRGLSSKWSRPVWLPEHHTESAKLANRKPLLFRWGFWKCLGEFINDVTQREGGAKPFWEVWDEDGKYRDKICVYDKHSIAGRDVQYQAPDSRSEYTTPFDDIWEHTCKRILEHNDPSYFQWLVGLLYSLHLELRLWADIWVIKHSGRGATLQE